LSSGSSEGCCPICGCPLVEIKYQGSKPEILALIRRKGFVRLIGCLRVDLHDKVMCSDHQGKVFVHAVFGGAVG